MSFITYSTTIYNILIYSCNLQVAVLANSLEKEAAQPLVISADFSMKSSIVLQYIIGFYKLLTSFFLVFGGLIY